MDDSTWWVAQMSGARAKYALCSGGFRADGSFAHDGRHCGCGEDAMPSVCMCPDDCNCHYSWRPTYCGCKGHEVQA